MAVIGTFGSFTTARLGIYASQASLNVTGNNIANINTPGYTRQRMDLISLHSGGMVRYANKFNTNIGYGVLCDGVSQLRDPYMDIRFRNEQAALGQAEAKLKGLMELGDIWDEVGKGEGEFGVVQNQIEDLLAQLEILSRRPGDESVDTIVRGSATTLAKLINDYANATETVYNNYKTNLVKDDVQAVNTLLTKIQDLNTEIRRAGIYDDKALELRDARNVAIDELSKYMKINVTYTTEPLDQYKDVEKLVISIAGTGDPAVNLVDGIYATQISIPDKIPQRDPTDPDDPSTGLNVQQADYTRDISKEDMLNAAQDNTYLQIVLDPLKDPKGRYMKDGQDDIDTYTVLGDRTLEGSLQAKRELLTEEGEFSSDADIAVDEKALEKRGIPYYMKALDALAQKLAKEFNEANQFDPNDAATYYENDGVNFLDANGNPIIAIGDLKYPKDPADPDYKAKKEDAYNMLEQLRLNGKLKTEYAYYNGGVLFSNSGSTNDPTGITAKNISVSQGWQRGSVRVLQTKLPDEELADGTVIDHTTRNDNIVHLINLMTKKLDYDPADVQPDAKPGVYFTGTFAEQLINTNATRATDENVTANLYSQYSLRSLELNNDRSSVSGVDLNEEATNMMQFQKSYSAACTLLTTLDSMLDKLINGTI